MISLNEAMFDASKAKWFDKITCLWLVSFIAIVFLVSAYSGTADSSVLSETNQRIECHQSALFSIAIREGTDNYIDVLCLKSEFLKGNCFYDSVNALFERKNLEETFFLDFKYPYLLLDAGTGPDPRVLTVIDVSKNRSILDTAYSSPAEFVDSDKIKFWTERKDSSFLKCKEFEKRQADGLGCAVDDEVMFDLRKHTFNKTGKSRCAPRQ
jgi:hypothetical protein